MTNTKFRKRALLSSVAMLLVALVALGSATFAWFSQNSKATANNIAAKTQQGSNIKVCETETGTFAESIDFAGANLVSASSFYAPVTPGGKAIQWAAMSAQEQQAANQADYAVTMTSPVWKTTTANNVDAGIQGTGKTWDNADAGTHYSTTDLYVLYDAASGTKNVNISFTDTAASGSHQDDFLRVALVPTGDTTTNVFGSAAVWGSDNDDFALDPTAFTALNADNTDKTITNTDSKTLFTNKTLTANVKYHFVVYVWFEGTDPQCRDSNANTNFDIDFAVEAAS